MRIVFDLDSTLADCSHRLHHIQKEPKDWNGFFSECFHDTLIQLNFQVLKDLFHAGHLIEIWTGRIEGKNSEVRNTTMAWLNNEGLVC